MKEEQPRRYNQWAGNPKGYAEDPRRCVADVPDDSGFHFYQCFRQRGSGKDGLYCWQHAKRHPVEESAKGKRRP